MLTSMIIICTHCFIANSTIVCMYSVGSTCHQRKSAPTNNEKKRKVNTSERAFNIISKTYEIRLGCDECTRKTDSNITGCHRFVAVTNHTCREGEMFLRKKNKSGSQADWVLVRSRPNSANLSDGICYCREQLCRRPHNDYENELWNAYRTTNINLSDLIRDIRSSSPVRAMYIVSKLAGNQRYISVCKTCYDNNHDNPATKRFHTPECTNGHEWVTNELCVFEEVNEHGTTYSLWEMDSIVTPQDLVQASQRARQRQESELNKTPQLCGPLTNTQPYNIVSIAAASMKDETHITVCFEKLLDSDHGSSDDDGLFITDGDTERESYYDIRDKSDLGNLLDHDYDRFKRCTLHLTGIHSAICTPEVAEGNLSKIPIKGRTNCGPTFDGDEVVVELIHSKELDKESTVLSGRVVGVLGGCVNRRAHVFICNVDEYMSCLMMPRGGTAPKIHIIDGAVKEKYGEKKNQHVAIYGEKDGSLQCKLICSLEPKDRQSKLFVVRYIKWNTGFMYPLGCIVNVIDPGRDLPTGQRILNLQHQVQQQFPADVVSYAERVHAPEVPDGRRDMRGEYTFSIDPPGCKDIDDALSVIRLNGNGNEVYEVYVHITDVTHYVTLSDPIDIEARRRGTTFYPEVGGFTSHMLPERLSEDLCSLLPGKDRLALSVRLTLDSDGNLIQPTPKVLRTVIKSDKQLTYTDVQEMLSSSQDRCRQNETGEEDAELRRRLAWLRDLSQRLRHERLKDTRFHSQYHGLFEVDDQATTAHELVDEFMILANREVAKFLVEKFPHHTPLRRQETPNEDEFQRWQARHAAVARRTFYFHVFNDLLPSSEEREDGDFPLLNDTARQLREAVMSGDISRVKTLVSSEQLHPEFALLFPSWYGIQEKSEYTRSGNGTSCRHFTLREDDYTHFTSPIRRYFDTVVHRLVKAAIDEEPPPYTPDEVDQLCRHLNYKMTQQKQYNKDLRSLKTACSLNSAAQFLPGVVEDISEGHVTVHLPHLHLRKEVKYGLLGVRSTDLASCDGDSPPDKVTLFWRRKIFDAGGCPTHARATCTVRESVRLSADAHVERIPRDQWTDVRRTIIASDTTSLLPDVRSMLSNARSSSNEPTPEVTSEMKTGEPMWRKDCDFQLTLKRNDTLSLQVFDCDCSTNAKKIS